MSDIDIKTEVKSEIKENREGEKIRKRLEQLGYLG